MLKMRPILLVNGILLTIVSTGMLVPAAVDYYADNPDWVVFIRSFFITMAIGGSLFLTNRGYHKGLSLRETFVLTASVWFIIPAFAALPFYFSEFGIDYTDALFEAVSGITTTGSTVLSGLDTAPPGILLWRAILQWLGGIGIIVLAMAILPMLQIGGMQLFRTESSDRSDKILPRTGQVSMVIGSVYVLFTGICALLLWYFGMSGFDAICHAMTTVGTAGFSTRDGSIGYFDSVAIEVTMIVFMILSAIPFVLYFQFARGRRGELLRNSQVQWLLGILLLCITAMTLWLHLFQEVPLHDALRSTAFNIVSIVTTTGFASADYSLWGSFAVTFFFLISVMGGCTGSTTGGIKIFRYQVLYVTAKQQISQLIHPHGVFIPLYNRKPIPSQISSSVLSFFILFAFCFLVLATLLSMFGLDYITSMSAAASALANLGPGLGPIIGPSGNFSSLPDGAKWLLSFGMILGRLELFTVLVLFSPRFWRE